MQILRASILIAVFFSTLASEAKIKTENVEYSTGKTKMQGFVAYDDSRPGPLPGVLIIHDWMGLADFQKAKAEELARQGYVAFAADIYGVGVRPQTADEAAKLAGQYKSDRPELRARARAAFDKLASLKMVNNNKIVAMGYCFGGTTALELARSGAPVAGTVSFHGGLSTPKTEDAKNIKGRVLALHGADDPFVPPAEVKSFKDEMKNANVKYSFVEYPGAVHSFTIPQAGHDKSKGAAYNAKADKASWMEFQKFLKQVL